MVDDGSSDGTKKIVKEKFPHIIILTGDGNLWWSGAMNKGIKYSLNNYAEYILSLNNDLEVAKDYIEKMIFWAEKEPEALLGSYTFDIETKKPIFGGSRRYWNKKDICLLDIIVPEKRKGLFWVTHLPGRGLWISAKAFKTIGLFDAEKLPQYQADYDFTLRAAKAGFGVYINFDARIYSCQNASVGNQFRLSFNIKNYIQHITSIKSSSSLKYFIRFALKNCPPKYRIQYLTKGIIFRLGGYPLHYTKQILGYKNSQNINKNEFL